jgi:catechol 2,3-dioxygenase-like lactoylglutathione lyase family enzyme
MNKIKKEYVRFQRANYIVTDLDKSLKLYCNVLGMINQYEADAPDNSYSYDVFEIKKQIRFVGQFSEPLINFV